MIHEPYRISRYPITVAQYQAFVDAKGYEKQEYWTAAGWAWRSKNDIQRPETYGGVFQTPDHPQAGVSWYEAVAFCAWLAEQTGLAIGLPSEAQWERAARHTDGRIYPWGNKDEPSQYCNMDETGIGSTSAVGSFANGNAVCGAADLAGNVWEWCRTKWLNDYNDYASQVDDDLAGDATRVVRGGSFFDIRVGVRCAFRVGLPRLPLRGLRFSGRGPRPLISGLCPGSDLWKTLVLCCSAAPLGAAGFALQRRRQYDCQGNRQRAARRKAGAAGSRPSLGTPVRLLVAL